MVRCLLLDLLAGLCDFLTFASKGGFLTSEALQLTKGELAFFTVNRMLDDNLVVSIFLVVTTFVITFSVVFVLWSFLGVLVVAFSAFVGVLVVFFGLFSLLGLIFVVGSRWLYSVRVFPQLSKSVCCVRFIELNGRFIVSNVLIQDG